MCVWCVGGQVYQAPEMPELVYSCMCSICTPAKPGQLMCGVSYVRCVGGQVYPAPEMPEPEPLPFAPDGWDRWDFRYAPLNGVGRGPPRLLHCACSLAESFEPHFDMQGCSLSRLCLQE